MRRAVYRRWIYVYTSARSPELLITRHLLKQAGQSAGPGLKVYNAMQVRPNSARFGPRAL